MSNVRRVYVEKKPAFAVPVSYTHLRRIRSLQTGSFNMRWKESMEKKQNLHR